MSIKNSNIIQTRATMLKKRSNDDFKLIVCEERKKNTNAPKAKPAQDTSKKRKISESSLESDNENSDADLDEIFSNKRTKTPKKEDSNIFNLKRARKEIINFGIAGMDKDKKTDAQIALAMKLGAKPPKNKYVNYKELKEQKKKISQEIAADPLKKIPSKNFGATQSYMNSKQKRKQNTVVSGDVLKHYGVVNPKIGKKRQK